MSLPILLAALAVVAGGAALAVQAPINAALARAVGDPLVAAVVSFAVGLAALGTVCLARGVSVAPGAFAAAPGWAWTGGLCGALYLVAVIWAVPRLGVVTTVAALVLGQLATALVLDAVGAFGLAPQAISAWRVGAVALVAAGLVLSRLS